MNRKTPLASMLAAALMSLASGATLAARAAPPVPVATVVNVAPPSGSWEVTPAPAEGYVWSTGIHEWQTDRYVWVPGEWLALRPGWDYRQRHWARLAEGQWSMTGGDWVRNVAVTKHR